MDKDDSAICEDSNEKENLDSMEEDDFSSYNRDDDDLDEIEMGLIYWTSFHCITRNKLEFPDFFRRIPFHLTHV